jgi:hypothetical protein
MSPPGHSSQTVGASVFSQEQYAEISKNPDLSEREGHSFAVSPDAVYS